MPDEYREPTVEAPSASGEAEKIVVTPEEEIKKLEELLAKKRATLGLGKEQITAERLAEVYRGAGLGAQPVAPTSSAVILDEQKKAVEITASKIKNLDAETQLKHLIDIAFNQNLNHAISVARELDNSYLIDRFHDILIDQLHQELVDRKKLEEI